MTRRRVLGLDVGERRIGVAVSDEGWLIASPVETVDRRRDAVGALGRLAATWDAERVVVGLPTGLSGREGPQAAAVRAFAAALEEALGPGRPVEFWDERLSTLVAERSLVASGVRRQERKGQIDAVAAAVILQGWLDHQRWRDGRRGAG